MQIAVLEGYRGVPGRSKMKRHHKRKSSGKTAHHKAMKACAVKHKVTTKGFWSCVRGTKK